MKMPFIPVRYAETVGVEGPFVSEPIRRDGNKEIYTIKLRGNLYKEVENVEIVLTTEDEERPKDFKFKVKAFNYSVVFSAISHASHLSQGLTSVIPHSRGTTLGGCGAGLPAP